MAFLRIAGLVILAAGGLYFTIESLMMAQDFLWMPSASLGQLISVAGVAFGEFCFTLTAFIFGASGLWRTFRRRQ